MTTGILEKQRTRSRLLPMGLALVALGVPGAGVGAQSASEVVDRMLDEYERRTANIDNYTLVQETMGIETQAYFEKEMVDGRPVFRPRSSAAAGVQTDLHDDSGVDDIYAMGEELGRRATYEGVQRLDDYDLHVLKVSDFSGLDFGGDMGPDSDFTAKSGTFFLDVDTYVPRRLEFVGDLRNDDGVHEVTAVISMADYRDVQGMLVPYHTEFTIEGLGQAIDDDTRAQFEEMQRQLEEMPPEQRAMVERMMAGQMEQFQEMMSGESSGMTFEVLVTDVRVNEGPPNG